MCRLGTSFLVIAAGVNLAIKFHFDYPFKIALIEIYFQTANLNWLLLNAMEDYFCYRS